MRLKLTARTRNYVGTIFGGSIYGAIDPIYMLMLIKILGPGYVVWDNAASIRFRKPGRSRLEAQFRISEDEVAAIHELAKREKSVTNGPDYFISSASFALTASPQMS